MNALANLGSRRPRRVLGLTAVLFVVAAVFGTPVFGLLKSNNDFEDPSSQSAQARSQLEHAAGTQVDVGLVALIKPGGPVSSPSAAAEVSAVAHALRSDPAVGRVVSFDQTRARALVSRDGTSTYVAATFRNLSSPQVEDAGKRLQSTLQRLPGVSVGGPALSGPAIGKQVGMDIGLAEGLAFPIILVLSLIFFRGLVAGLLPIFVGAITVLSTFLVLRLVNDVVGLSVFALNLVIALGLGLAIDYSLFIVSRYREEMVRHGPGAQAIRRTLLTAGRTIIFSSLTVAAALASLLIFPQRFLYSMGLGGVLVTLIALLTALVALPALLVLLGPRVNALAPKRWQRAVKRTAEQERSGFWYRLARAVTRRPLPIAVVSAAALIAVGLPFLGIKFTGTSANDLPANLTVRQVDDALRTQFQSNRTSPIDLAVQAGPSDGSRVRVYAQSLNGLPGAAAVTPPRLVGAGVWQVGVVSRYPALDARSQALVKDVRSRGGPFPVAATGESAAFVDQQSSLASRLPYGIALLAVLTLMILFLLTGSVVLPIKSLLMNLLTVSAAFGLLVLIFQDGRLQGLLGFTSQGALEATQPILLFALVFGLSTDYAVFLLSRIKEARDSGLPDNDAVAVGLERTGRIVTAAALLFCVAIGAFATSKVIFIKEVGVGTALAVIIDATIVRALLVPSLMALLGRRNWWAPAPLRRIHARLGLSEADPA
ncbi:MAG: MMPL family transporter [Solirubrobacteraceae bacterium]